MVVFLKENVPQARFFDKTKCAADITYHMKCAAGQIFVE